MTAALAAVGFPHWHFHPDVWLLVVVLEGAFLLAMRRERARRGPGADPPVSAGQVAAFTGGVVALWLASDWPVHDLAEGYLYSVHMVQHLVMTLVAALLLVAGTPGWMARRLLKPRAVMATVRFLARPVPGLIQFNTVMVLSHWPEVVEATVRFHALHFVAHAVLLVSAVLMWLPVVSNLPEVPRLPPMLRMMYLFLQTIIPTVPASFLTFGTKPLYPIYAEFPRLWGISALDDQLVAGLIMKVGAGFYLWIVIATIFFRWYNSEERDEQAARAARRSGEPVKPTSDDVLTWAKVEEEFERLDSQRAHPSGPSGGAT